MSDEKPPLDLDPGEYREPGKREPILHPGWWWKLLLIAAFLVVGGALLPYFRAFVTGN